jgi:sterol desaturase/sphingolipid hydroxylase (fatty acid hydroxylase superfamily)
MGHRLAVLFIAFILVGAAFYSLEAVFPACKSKPLWRKDSLLDFGYWFFTPFAGKMISKAAVLVAAVLVASVLGWKIVPVLVRGHGPLATQPVSLLAIEVLVVGDLIGYWIHRWFHQGRMWKFHAVHHSSTEVDWLSSVRLHPVNEVTQEFLQFIPLMILGFPLGVLAGYAPFLTFYAIFVHANVDWSFGPLRYVITTPLFHRWHHTSEEEALDKNFAGLFPLWDMIFGTFYMPEHKVPRQFGVVGDALPPTLWGQMLYPFR